MRLQGIITKQIVNYRNSIDIEIVDNEKKKNRSWNVIGGVNARQRLRLARGTRHSTGTIANQCTPFAREVMAELAVEHVVGPTRNPTDNAARKEPAAVAAILKIQTIPPGRRPHPSPGFLPFQLRRLVGGKTIYYSNREDVQQTNNNIIQVYIGV